MLYTSCVPDGCYLSILLNSKKEVDTNKVVSIITNEIGIRDYTISTSKWVTCNKKIFNFGKNRNFYSEIDFVTNDTIIGITDKEINNIKKKCKLSYVCILVQPKYKTIIHEIL